ncbi:MAG: phosphoribosylanthranilate isomerase [Sneathiella sp.]|uniref:phosphoribosylanthranilate isomerase n=1 Tax=Sneathiella sp. TaxID=1964365 RepID=UPI000C5AC80D|nr:phosphoribosylanthranilate isomerase [Sneathiella sp.]MAZ02549.1 phosphoribosylanthranilate isomerase [Sneathiella sp.]
MTVAAKICGLTDAASVAAAVENGAAYVGFVFYGRSPRNVTPEEAATLAAAVPAHVEKVGLFVDPDDALIRSVLDAVSLEWIQLHGSETPERVAEIKQKFNRKVMKAIPVAEKADFNAVTAYENVADMLLFDAKAPKTMADALPGGNGLVFDWQMMRGLTISVPWMLAGGLTAENVTEAVTISGAEIVDTSSGVEFEPGHKNPAAIVAFLTAVKAVKTN